MCKICLFLYETYTQINTQINRNNRKLLYLYSCTLNVVGVQVCCFEYRPARHLYGSFLSRKRHVSVSFPGHVPTHCPTFICCRKQWRLNCDVSSGTKKFKYRWYRGTIGKIKEYFQKNTQNRGYVIHINDVFKINFS